MTNEGTDEEPAGEPDFDLEQAAALILGSGGGNGIAAGLQYLAGQRGVLAQFDSVDAFAVELGESEAGPRSFIG